MHSRPRGPHHRFERSPCTADGCRPMSGLLTQVSAISPCAGGRRGRKTLLAPALSHSLGLMTQYKISNESSAVSIELTGVAGHQKELLVAFQECQECQEGTCSCPTDEYQNVASMTVDADESRIAIRLEAKPGAKLDVSEIESCLDYTIGRVEPAR